MDLQEVADGMTQRVSGKSPLGGTLKFDLGAKATSSLTAPAATTSSPSTRTIPPDAPSP